MDLLNLTTLLVAVTAALAWLNARYLRLPAAIGVTVVGLAASFVILLLVALDVPAARQAVTLVRDVEFNAFVFQGVLSFLLFAGALGMNSHALWQVRGPVVTFALLSTVMSTALVGLLTFGLLSLFGLHVPLVYCLLFGALISPTDPVAVLSILKQARVPKRIETLVAGESLFNDGIGVVAFVVLAGIAGAAHGSEAGSASVAGVVSLFFQEALGGLGLGVALGTLGWLALRAVGDFTVEVLVSLAVVLGCTALAGELHVSAPLAAVAAGLLVGLLTDRVPSALSSRDRFEGFWHLTDELLNAFLFVLLALEVLVVRFSGQALLLGVLAVPLVLGVRAVSVQLPVLILRRRYAFSPFTRRVMTWGGLRGAISLALAFSLPTGSERDLLLVMTYVVVVFSIVVQGLSVGRLAAGAAETHSEEPARH